MKLVFTPTAEAQANEMDAWWRAHREKAPDLFARELADACEVIATTPTAGTTYITAGGTAERIYAVCACPRPATISTSKWTPRRRRSWC